ncbi:hypothetical protein M422DRAFT_40075, partial [Sphaerobolus stellatus SS14]
MIEKTDISIEQLQFSKLGRVMRLITKLDQTIYPIPNNDEFRIQKRADALLEKWQSLILASEFAGIMIADGANEETIPENNGKIEKAAFAGEENNV